MTAAAVESPTSPGARGDGRVLGLTRAGIWVLLVLAAANGVFLYLAPGLADTDYAWTFKAFDPCTATTTDVGSGHFTARAGWVQIISDRTVKLPATRGQLSVVAVTTSPDEAQSPALGVGQGSC